MPIENVSQWVLKNSKQLPSIVLNPVKNFTNTNSPSTKPKFHNSFNSIGCPIFDKPMVEINMYEKSRSYGNDQLLNIGLEDKNQKYRISIETFDNIYGESEPSELFHKKATPLYERRSVCYGSLGKGN